MRAGSLLRLLVVIAWATTSWPAAGAEGWPQWRGPDRTARVSSHLPNTWPPELTRVWRVEVGAGLSSPIIANRRGYLLTNDGDDEVVRVTTYHVADSPTWTYPAVVGNELLIKDERYLTLWRVE